MGILQERMRQLRKQNHLTQEQLAQKLRKQYNLKTDRVMISKWETGFQTPGIYSISCMANIFGVSLDYLNGKDNSAQSSAATSALPSPVEMEAYGLRSITMKKFPMLGEIACGEPIYCNQDYETFIEASANIKADFCLEAKGDSMINARIFNGDIVFIRAQNDVENGEIAAVVIDDTATLKRVYKHQNSLELRAENPMHKPINLEGVEMETVRILGKAVAFQSNII